MPCAFCGSWVQRPVWTPLGSLPFTVREPQIDADGNVWFTTCSLCTKIFKLVTLAVSSNDRRLCKHADKQLGRLLADLDKKQSGADVPSAGPAEHRPAP